jgi:5-hydroxyisourate hydrolase
MTTLSTHVLDTSRGAPAAAVRLILYREGKALWDGATDTDGRCPELNKFTLGSGRYLLEFAVADYFRSVGTPLAEPPFLDVVVIEFGIADEGHYHVPLLVAPYGYSTYRGS